MKKLIFGIFLLMFILVGCSNKEIKVYSDEEVDEYNVVLENIGNGKTKAYDLREYQECYAGRIPNFYCSRVEQIEDETEALDRIASNLMILLINKKRTMIILIDNDGSNANYVATKLFQEGYTNIHYFKNGYDRYVELQDNFVPETGECDC